MPVASHNGLPCSGHGIPIPATIHNQQPCGSSPIPFTIEIKNKTCWWPPTPLIPLTGLTPERATVLVNKIPIMLEMDVFTPHRSITTNIINYLCPCGKAMCIIPTPFGGSILTIEDKFGVGHERVLNATTFTVFTLSSVTFLRFIARSSRILAVLSCSLSSLFWFRFNGITHTKSFCHNLK